MALSPEDSAKSVQVKVPVVATITQKMDSNGKMSYLVEPPGPDQEQGFYKFLNYNSSINYTFDLHLGDFSLIWKLLIIKERDLIIFFV